MGLRGAQTHILRRFPAWRISALVSRVRTALWPAGTIARAYRSHRQAILESVIEADPVAICMRDLMATQNHWVGWRPTSCKPLTSCSAKQLLSAHPIGRAPPRALACRPA